MQFNMPGYETLELSTQIIIKEAVKRNIHIDVLDWTDNFIRLKKDNRIEYIKQATRTSMDSYISPLIMENKNVTKIILAENNLNVPIGKTFNEKEPAFTSWSFFTNKNIVIKPKSTNFGKGISILKNNQSYNDFKKAIEFAFKYDSSIIIENFIEGNEYRFLIIGNEVAAILHRIPANVIGDGNHSITDLVEIKNKDPLRGIGYKTPLEKITLGATEKTFLKLQNKDIHYIPKKNEQVFLRKNSNVSTGGDSIDYTDEVRNEYKEIALHTANAVRAKICGADIIIKDIKAKPDKNNYAIIELNFNPAIHMHNFPYKGKNRDIGKKILDLLGF